MKKRASSFIIFLVLVILSASCATVGGVDADEYGLLGSAATSCAAEVIGVYADSIPDDFSREKLLSICEDRIPGSFFAVLKKYPSEVTPKTAYYLLRIYDLHGKELIMFHYSCSPEAERVVAHPEKYDLNNLDLYDVCKSNEW